VPWIGESDCSSETKQLLLLRPHRQLRANFRLQSNFQQAFTHIFKVTKIGWSSWLLIPLSLLMYNRFARCDDTQQHKDCFDLFWLHPESMKSLWLLEILLIPGGNPLLLLALLLLLGFGANILCTSAGTVYLKSSGRNKPFPKALLPLLLLLLFLFGEDYNPPISSNSEHKSVMRNNVKRNEIESPYCCWCFLCLSVT